MNPIRWQQLERVKRGSVLVLVCVFIIALFAFAALSIDVSHVLQQQRNLQSGTDAAALAAVVYLTNTTWSAGAIQTAAVNEANAIAAANGVTSAEIAASSYGTVEVGQWVVTATSTSFVAGATPYNAVLVPAKRTVTMNFAQLIGMTAMRPSVSSVAVISALNSVQGGSGLLIPYGVPTNQLSGVKIGSVVTIGTDGSGNWGKISLCGDSFDTAMVNGVSCTVSVGDMPNSSPGVSGVSNGFNERIAANPIVMIAVVDDFGDGKKPVTIEGFVLAELLSDGGNGSGWNGQIQILGNVIATSIGGGVGGINSQPYAWARSLVQ